MDLAILFWVYKEPELCVERARLLRRFNPGRKIYVLFGGAGADRPAFEAALASVTDDFYAFDEPWPAQRKWLHGDQLISAWHRDRGRHLTWDTIFIAQWDLLMLAPLEQLCGALQADELLLPGLRPVDEVADWWWWTRPGSEERRDYDAFLASLGACAPAHPLCCNFLAAALPRRFLDRYAQLATPDVGFLEYKMPIYAQAWGFGFCTRHAFNPFWRTDPAASRLGRRFATLHAEKGEIPTLMVQLNSVLPWGRRVFHPYVSRTPAKWGMAAPT